MPSPTSRTEDKRKRKHQKQGKARKRLLEKKGTTPTFPIHPDKGPEKKKG